MAKKENKKSEEVSFQLIWHAGNSKSCSMEAISAAYAEDYDAAQKKLEEAAAEMKEAHQIQTDLLHNFANGDGMEVDILMVHAQDHLNGAIMALDFAKQIITLNKKVDDLQKRVQSLEKE